MKYKGERKIYERILIVSTLKNLPTVYKKVIYYLENSTTKGKNKDPIFKKNETNNENNSNELLNLLVHLNIK